MNRRRRTEILIRGSVDLVKELAEQIEKNYAVTLTEEPNYGLVMIKSRETARKSLYYLGEVLVTEAKVQIKDKLGIGIVSGNNPELSYYLAVIDAAYNNQLPETASWEKMLTGEEAKILENMHKAQSKILATRVKFDTMDI